MPRLWIYACSFGNHGTSLDNRWEDRSSFGQLLASDLGYELANRSRAGSSNHAIALNMLDDHASNRWQPGDAAVVQWTMIDRGWTSRGVSMMPHVARSPAADLRELAETYYMEFHDPRQNLLHLLGSAMAMQSFFPGRLVQLSADPDDLLRSTDAALHGLLISQPSWRSWPTGSMAGHLRSVGGADFFYACSHPSQQGHAEMARIIKGYLDGISPADRACRP